MSTPPFSRLAYDEAEAAALCSVGDDEIRRWVKDGRITPIYAGTRASKPLYLPEELDAALRSLPREKGAAR